MSTTGLLLYMGRTVCDIEGDAAANTICREMGFGDAMYYGPGK